MENLEKNKALYVDEKLNVQELAIDQMMITNGGSGFGPGFYLQKYYKTPWLLKKLKGISPWSVGFKYWWNHPINAY